MAYIPTRWGRTNRPKAPDNVDNRPTGYRHVTGASGLAGLNAFLSADGTGSLRANLGAYQTENQRYAHIMTSGSATITDVCLYTYAGGYWQSLHTGSTVHGGGKVYVGPNSHRVVEIYGADWISVVTGSGGKVTLAFSTF
jgi:hypothetical protein